MRQVRADADAVLGRHQDTALYLDETSFVKKGRCSVGVQRQYCGRLGKLANCQVRVFACLGRGGRAALVDFRLFLPQGWVDDPEQCRKAKVPASERNHETKGQLALAMVRQARAAGLSQHWVGGDEIYGNNRPLTDALDDDGEIFLLDISSTHQLWDRDPAGTVADYEVRGWQGCHHHIALVCLALLFTLKERLTQAGNVPLLSVRDIVELLDIYLPRRSREPAEVLAVMSRRHQARQKAIDSAHKRNHEPEIIITK